LRNSSIVRYAPLTSENMREKLANGELSWSKAKEILRKALQAPPGNEKQIIEDELTKPARPTSKPLPFQKTLKRLSVSMKDSPNQTFKANTQDLYSLLVTLRGKNVEQADLDRVRKAFPVLWDDE